MGYPVFIGLFYGPEIIGNFSVLFYWSTILNIPISNGLAISITRYIATRREHEKTEVEGVGIKLAFFYLIGMIIIYPFLGIFVFSLSYLEIIIVVTILINLAFHYLFRKSFQGREKFSFISKIELISLGFFIPSVIFFSILPKYYNLGALGFSYHYLFIPVIVYHFVFNAWILVTKWRSTDYKDNIFRFPKETKQILLYATFITLGSLFSIGMSQIQIILSDIYLYALEVGVLSFWTFALTVIGIFTVAIGSLLLPRIANLSKANDNNRLLEEFVNSINWVLTLIILPLSIFIFIIIAKFPFILEIITLYKFNMAFYWLVAILLCFKEINLLLIEPTIAYILSSEKNVRYYPLIALIHAFSVTLSWVFLIPKFGIIGFAIGIALGSFIFVIINMIFILIISKKKIGLHVILYLMITLFGGGTIMLFKLWDSNILILIWSILTICSIIFGIFKLTEISKKKEYVHDYTSSIEITKEKSIKFNEL